jgi:phage terminase large subunit-like protein
VKTKKRPTKQKRAAKSRRRRRPDPVTAYARAVVAGREIAGRYVVQACMRHMRDLEHGAGRGLRFDLDRANRAIEFCGSLRATRGRWAKDYLVLSPAQQFIVGSIFGWIRVTTGLRRFRTAYIEVARKFGKSELCGALALLAGFFDEPTEWGGEAYCAATKKDQAKIVVDISRTMVRRSPALKQRLRVLAGRIVDVETGSYLTALGADGDTLDGLSPHVVIIDELHAHPSSEVVDVMESGTGARAQPLQIEITTAGEDTMSICYDHHQHSVRVLDPAAHVGDDEWFAFIACANPDADVSDPRAWKMANPNLGVTVQEDWYEIRSRRARGSPTALAEFRRKNLCLWTAGATKAIDPQVWDRGARPYDLAALRNRPCYGAFDLAAIEDTSAFVLVWPPSQEERWWTVSGRYYVPEENIERRARATDIPYDRWAREGKLIATPGNVIDHDWIEADIKRACSEFNVREVAFDRAMATQLVTHLVDARVPLVQFGQGFMSMSQPTKDFLRLVAAGLVVHGGDPVLRWMATNLVLRTDPAGNWKPDKAKSKEKIDGIVATIMAVGRAMLAPTKVRTGRRISAIG